MAEDEDDDEEERDGQEDGTFSPSKYPILNNHRNGKHELTRNHGRSDSKTANRGLLLQMSPGHCYDTDQMKRLRDDRASMARHIAEIEGKQADLGKQHSFVLANKEEEVNVSRSPTFYVSMFSLPCTIQSVCWPFLLSVLSLDCLLLSFCCTCLNVVFRT